MLQFRLIVIMQRELDAQGLQLTPYCTQQLEQLLTRGVERMRNNRALDHAGHVLTAERNVKKLVNYFADYSHEAGTFPSLENADFDAALRSSPTIWPYCVSG